jgi:hypothetical protein
VIGIVLFAEAPSGWLACSVLLVMLALWFDNRARLPQHQTSQ